MHRMKLLLIIALGHSISACVGVEDNNTTIERVVTQLHDVVSKSRGGTVPVSVLLPPNFDKRDTALPLLIHLHGGGGDQGKVPAGLKPTLQVAALVQFAQPLN